MVCLLGKIGLELRIVKSALLTQCMVRPCGARGFRRSGKCGLASMYPVSDWSSSWLPTHHGYQRARDLISGQASTGLFGSPVFACAGKTDPPSSSHPLADLGWYVIDSSSFCAVPLFVPGGCSFVPACGCRRAAHRDRQDRYSGALLYPIETARRAIYQQPGGLDCARFARDCGGLRPITGAEFFVDSPKMGLDGVLGQE
jgi:hypothetical protein